MRRLLIGSAAAVGAAAVLALAFKLAGPAARWWYDWRHPPLAGTDETSLGASIVAEREGERLRRFGRDYARVRAELDAARGRGFNVAALERRLSRAVDAARRGEYQDASLILNRVEFEMPRGSPPRSSRP